MKIVMTGATGFIGPPLCAELVGGGHQVTVLARDTARAQAALGKQVRSLAWEEKVGEGKTSDTAAPAPAADWKQAVAEADAVINLAGASVAGQKWTPEYKAQILSSRVETTRKLVQAMRDSPRRPSVFLSASAIGYYGDRKDEAVTETALPGNDFLADVCKAWEAEAQEAEGLGVRVARLRIGVVLGHGGALEKMLHPLPLPFNPYKLGLGGRIGSGKQWLSWIHLDDVLGLMTWALTNADVHGAVNITAPNPCTNSDFTHTLGHIFHRPAALPVPAFALRAMLGEFADTLLKGQKALPSVAEQQGYRFRFPTLEPALKSLLTSGKP